MAFTTPVVFLIFNRPETTERVFREIARARPQKLFVVADGPRPDSPDDVEKCVRTRAVVEQVDWECEVLTNYAETNLGCGVRPASGIDWVFEQCEEAIILEDDCLPHPTFFRFCAELLDRYRHDERVMMISGDNFQFGRQSTPYSYYYSRHNHVWGWATWRRAWQHFDIEMKRWPELRDTGWLLNLWGDALVAEKWRAIFDKTYPGLDDIWDYQWAFAWWSQHGLAILPEVNLISNIGFGPDASHTKKEAAWTNLPVEAMRFPLRHPPCMVPDVVADRFTNGQVFKQPPRSFYQRLRRRLAASVWSPSRRQGADRLSKDTFS